MLNQVSKWPCKKTNNEIIIENDKIRKIKHKKVINDDNGSIMKS